MKKMIMFFAIASTIAVFGHPDPRRPYPHPGSYGPRIHHAPPPPPPRHHHHHSSAAPFWTGVGVGILGSLIAPPPPPPPVVIQATRVWVPPVYGERPIYRAGIYIGTERYIITPGYWR